MGRRNQMAGLREYVEKAMREARDMILEEKDETQQHYLLGIGLAYCDVLNHIDGKAGCSPKERKERIDAALEMVEGKED